jgi:NADH:ubiquinone oxidoreductase subunit 4 (subunit M)
MPGLPSLDLRPRELAMALLLAALVLLAGLWPQGVLGLMNASTAAWVARVAGS